eukprot:3562923-Prymnesium_polylepis.1
MPDVDRGVPPDVCARTANFRDYEALAHGAIPLVDFRDDPKLWAASLYSELPVLPVVNWNTITPAYLNEVYRRWNYRLRYPWRRAQGPDRAHWPPRWPGVDLRRLYTPYWIGAVAQLLGGTGGQVDAPSPAAPPATGTLRQTPADIAACGPHIIHSPLWVRNCLDHGCPDSRPGCKWWCPVNPNNWSYMLKNAPRPSRRASRASRVRRALCPRDDPADHNRREPRPAEREAYRHRARRTPRLAAADGAAGRRRLDQFAAAARPRGRRLPY